MDANTTHTTEQGLLDSTAVARQLNVEPDTVKLWRLTGRGPAFIRISHQCVRYRQADIDAFLAARTHQPEAA